MSSPTKGLEHSPACITCFSLLAWMYDVFIDRDILEAIFSTFVFPTGAVVDRDCGTIRRMVDVWLVVKLIAC